MEQKNDPYEIIDAYQVISRACVQLSRAWTGSKFYFSTANIPGDDNPTVIKCRGIVSGRVPFVIGVRDKSAISNFHGYLFMDQVEWRTWTANSNETRKDGNEYFKLVRAANLNLQSHRELAMPQNAIVRITPHERLQIVRKNRFATDYLPKAILGLDSRLDTDLHIDGDAYDLVDKKMLYRHELSTQMQHLLGHTISTVRRRLEQYATGQPPIQQPINDRPNF